MIRQPELKIANGFYNFPENMYVHFSGHYKKNKILINML